MPKEKRQYFMDLMKQFVKHWVGNNDLANEARAFVATLEADMKHIDDDEFRNRLSKWDTILSQAPEWLYRLYAKSGASFRYATPAHSAVLSA
ncbi:MAG: hypothetical protein NT116_03495 [Candidatus Parcubacteria bacterium]|nr:hypothetical protein [Candidatus Parcubacteria bacterium]